MLYHDAAAEIAYVLVPDALQIAQADQERAIGRLTNRLLDSLPVEQRRSYLLQPQTFLSESSFRAAVANTPQPRSEPVAAAVELDELIRLLQQAQAEGVLDSVAGLYRPLFDYQFFLALTERSERTSDSREADALRALRAALVAAIDASDAAAQAEINAALAVLRELAVAADPVAAVQARPDDLTTAFFLVLDANLQAAGAEGRSDLAYVLTMIQRAAVEVVEEAMPPVTRLVSRLARATDPLARQALLDAEPDLIGEPLELAVRESADLARQSGAQALAGALESAAAEVAQRRAQVAQPA